MKGGYFLVVLVLGISLSFTSCTDQKICENGLHGHYCDYKICDVSSIEASQCQNGGVCLQHNTTTSIIKCKCKGGYSGPLCNVPPCLNHCYNNGYCEYENNRMKCSCSERFTGDKCQFDKCIHKVGECGPSSYMTDSCECVRGHECDKKYCKNNGKCFDNNGQLGCKCRVGFSGPVCAIDNCKGYCFNGGECHLGHNSVSCSCPDGYKSDKRCGIKDIQPRKIATEKEMKVPTEYRSTRIIMYALSITLFICLISIGGYISIQRGMFSFLLTSFDHKGSNNSSPSASYTRGTSLPFAKSNLNFNKLEEDEESIVNNFHQDI